MSVPGHEATASSEQAFVISRVFDAPRDVVWKAWTEMGRITKWFGPKSSVLTGVALDLRPGGVFHYKMRFANQDMWGRMVYREIAAPERLVWVNSFSDPQGGVTRHPLSPTWPIELLTTVTFTEQGGQTTVTVRWVPLNPSDVERKTFDAGHQSMRAGWGGTFEQLTEYLKRV